MNPTFTFTGFCQEASGHGTIWIDSFELSDNDVELARKRARDLCAEAWGYPPADVHVLGISEGNINLVFWEDLNDD